MFDIGDVFSVWPFVVSVMFVSLVIPNLHKEIVDLLKKVTIFISGLLCDFFQFLWRLTTRK